MESTLGLTHAMHFETAPTYMKLVTWEIAPPPSLRNAIFLLGWFYKTVCGRWLACPVENPHICKGVHKTPVENWFLCTKANFHLMCTPKKMIFSDLAPVCTQVLHALALPLGLPTRMTQLWPLPTLQRELETTTRPIFNCRYFVYIWRGIKVSIGMVDLDISQWNNFNSIKDNWWCSIIWCVGVGGCQLSVSQRTFFVALEIWSERIVCLEVLPPCPPYVSFTRIRQPLPRWWFTLFNAPIHWILPAWLLKNIYTLHSGLKDLRVFLSCQFKQRNRRCIL
jgi:hypothetical protein